MPRRPKWVGKDLYNLVTLPLSELARLYPQEKLNTLKGKRNYWKTKIKNGDIPMPNPERETHTEEVVDGQLVSSIEGWYEVVTKNADGEAEVHRLYKHSTKTRPTHDALESFEPAQPARITPSRRKPITRDYRTYFVFGDAQIDYRRMDDNELVPIHDERAMRVARLVCRDVRPDEIVNLGDNVDLSSLSRFKADSDHFYRTLGHSFQRAHDYYAEFRSDNPDAKIIEVSSNHEVRLRDWVLKNMPQVYGLKRPGAEDDYPVMTYPYLANLKHVRVEWVGGYAAAEYKIGGNEDLIARHGRETSSNGTTASKIMKNHPETNNIHGHSHEMSMASRTLRSGKVLASIAVGALCRTTGEVPGYHSAVDDDNEVVHRQQNWQQGVLVIYDYGEGHYQFDQIPIIKGRAFYQGKEYDGGDD